MSILLNAISPCGLGTSNIASLGRAMKQNDFNKLLHAAIDNEINIIDTANTYGSGDSEFMIGKSIRNIRDDLFIMTKAGLPVVNLPEYLSPLNQIGKKVLQRVTKRGNYSKKNLIFSLEMSLKRLNVDYVDCFFLHEPSFDDLINSNDYYEGLDYIKSSGMSRSIGVSTNEIAVLKDVEKYINIDIVQSKMPYFSNHKNILFYCNEKNIPIIVNQVFSGLNEVNLKSKIEMLFNKHNIALKEMNSVLVSYAINHLKIDSLIIGTRNLAHLQENILAKNLNVMDYKALFDDISNL
jgi:aryl-alcohol dehydrogenase-like predicted oxidoreductase